jgi:6-phospho 3-hexuloisomerase
MPEKPLEALRVVAGELSRVLSQGRADEMQALQDAILGAQSVFVTGEGRSGLVARCFAMRLAHLGLKVQVVGETVTSAFRPGDLLIAVSGSGTTSATCLHASSAADQGGRAVAVTANPGSPLARSADLALLVPSQGSVQFGGALFEQSALVLLDAIALALQTRLGRTSEEMQARHATLE